MAFALPHRSAGRVWRVARKFDAKVVQQVTEGDVGPTVVLVFKATGKGTTTVAFGLDARRDGEGLRVAPLHRAGSLARHKEPAQKSGRASTSGSTLRGMNCPSPGSACSLPSSTTTRPRRIVVTGQPLTSQPSQGL